MGGGGYLGHKEKVFDTSNRNADSATCDCSNENDTAKIRSVAKTRLTCHTEGEKDDFFFLKVAVFD